MSDPTVSPRDMPTPPLDLDTADRLLAGSIHPDDAPDGYQRVAALVAAAREPASTTEPAEPPDGLAELITSAPPAVTPTGRSRRRFATVAVAATMLIGGSGAAAATNNLPAPVQRTVSNLGSHLGLSIPEPAEPAEPSSDLMDPDVEVPSATNPDVGEGTPDLEDQLPLDPDAVDELIPRPPLTLPVQPGPAGRSVTSEPCALGETLTAAGGCVAVDQLDAPGVQPLPTTSLPDVGDLPGPPG